MITFKAIIIPGNRRKDGTYPVNIRVTFKGKSRRLATTLVCTTGDLTRTLKIKNATILNKSDALIGRMRDAVKDLSPFDLESQDVDFVVTHIKDSMTREDFRLDFFEWSERYILNTKTESTRRAYSSALNSLERFLGRRSIDINDISRSLLVEYKEMVDSQNKIYFRPATGARYESGTEKVPMGASSRYLSRLEHMFNAAKDKYNDEDAGRILIPRSPFSKIPKAHPVSHGQESLGVEVMQRVISAQADGVMRTALDIFIVSFGLMGVNMADLYCARPVREEWVYNRKKTERRRADKALMKVSVPHQLKPFLDRLRGSGAWWLNNLHGFANNKDAATARVNRWLRRWCEENGLKVFTLGAARHTWATLGRKTCGIDKSTIDDCLCHVGSFRITDIYAEKAWDLMQEANQQVLSLFTW